MSIRTFASQPEVSPDRAVLDAEQVIKINPDIPLIKTNIGKIKFIIKREIVSDWMNKATNKHRCRKLRYT